MVVVLKSCCLPSHSFLTSTFTSDVFFVIRAITFLNHTVPDFTDNGASNFIKYGHDYYATSETNYIRMIDPVTLETKEKVTISAHLHPTEEVGTALTGC